MEVQTNTHHNAIFRFYGPLNDFLPPNLKQKNIHICFENHQTLKDVIEALGIPHPEVHAIFLNGMSVSFSSFLKPESRVAVYPFFQNLNLTDRALANSVSHEDLHFILDVHLGKLARNLRFAGFDTLLYPGMDDADIVMESTKSNRIILTRDIGLLKHKKVLFGYWLRSQDPKTQFLEIISHFQIRKEQIQPWKRCSLCNGTISSVNKDQIEKTLNPGTRKFYKTFFQCRNCGKVYWKGSHYQKLDQWLKQTINSIPE